MKNYQEALEWMYGRLPMYQREGKPAVKKGLDNIRAFLDLLKNPQNDVPVIHVAGTNGKGSVASMLASVLKDAGYKVGLYTSPHLKDFRERITVNGKPVQMKVVTGFVRRHKSFIEEKNLSFFELTVAMAFFYFKKMKANVAVVETGLGGRLDSTNVVKPVMSIITNVQKDHIDMLGTTLREIAFEKAGIIKPKTPVIAGFPDPEVKWVIEETARQRQAPLIWVEQEAPSYYESDLKGPYQSKNIAIVLAAVDRLRMQGWHVSESSLRSGLLHVKENTGFRGRWDLIGRNPTILLDTAHNPPAFDAVLKGLNKMMAERKHFVLGFVRGKDVEEIVKKLPSGAAYYLSAPDVPRAMPVEELAKVFDKYGFSYETYPGVRDAFQAAKENAGRNDLIIVTGSTFTVAEVL